LSFFTPQAFKSLYLAADSAPNVGSVAFVLAECVAAPGTAIDLDTALTQTKLEGSFIFSPQPLDFGGSASAQKAFVEAFWAYLAPQPVRRGMLWLADPSVLSEQRPTLPFLGLSGDGGSVDTALTAPITLSLSLSVSSGMMLSVSGDTVAISSRQPQFAIAFTGPGAPDMSIVTTGTLPFSGAERGCLTFDAFIGRQSLNDDWQLGFHFVFAEAGAPEGLISEWLPLADASGPIAADMIGFALNIDPADPYNDHNPLRTVMLFTGTNQHGEKTIFASYYRTIAGAPLTLTPIGTGQTTAKQQPGGLVFALGQRVSAQQEEFHVCPIGDFVADAAYSPDGKTSDLLCGIQGTEYFNFTPGNSVTSAARLRFKSRQPAFAPKFPPPTSSPVGPPSDPTATLLDPTYMTAWAT